MTCGYCGTELPATALFCGECGRSLAAPARRPTVVTDTAILDAVDLAEIDGATVVTRSRPAAPVIEHAPHPVAEPVETSEPEPEPEPEPAPAPAPEPEPEPETEPEPEPEPVVEPVETPAPAPVVVRDPLPAADLDPWKPPARLLRAAPAPAVEDDIEQTRIVANPITGQRFVLQFSTGESVTIFGTGLVGRNPVAEPAEYFDHVVTIVDPGKSVSKTHLEFGEAAGMFWVSDRFSGNGTVIREPDSAPRRCEPGKRYRIARGTRVTMGEQFFVVS